MKYYLVSGFYFRSVKKGSVNISPYSEVSLSPIIPVTTIIIQTIRKIFFDSSKKYIPIIIVPAAPIPLTSAVFQAKKQTITTNQ
jgi:hypothetical protein